MSGTIPRSSNARRTPIWANPLRPPPPRTSAMRLLTDSSVGWMVSDAYSMDTERSNAVPAWIGPRRPRRRQSRIREGRARKGARPPPSDDRALLEVLVQSVESDDRTTHRDDGAGVVADDQSGEERGTTHHHQRDRLPIALPPLHHGVGRPSLLRDRLAYSDRRGIHGRTGGPRRGGSDVRLGRARRERLLRLG